MAFLDPQEAFEHFRERTTEGITSYFPIKGKTHTVVLDKVEVKDAGHPDDIRAQHKAKVEGDSFVAPLYGHLRLIENSTGKEVDKVRMRLAEVPRQTERYSYILNGQEYQVDNQWQLKPGAYTRRRQNGELETRFNATGAAAFDLVFDDKSKQFFMEYNKSKLPLYPFMKAMGVSDTDLEHTWGKEIFAANKTARGGAGAVQRFYKSLTKADAPSQEAAEQHLREIMASSKMRPDATEVTLGKPFDSVTGEALHLAANKMLAVYGGHPEDDRDSLIFKDYRAAGDYANDKLKNARRTVLAKVSRNLNSSTSLRDILKFDFFNDPVKKSFTDNPAARLATQINPVEMISSVMQTTIMGSGGIKSEQQVTNEAKMLNPTHFGFLDPLNTPEGNPGITLRLPLGVQKKGNETVVPLYNVKTGKTEMVNPAKFFQSNIVLADQVDWKNGKPVPRSKEVMAAGKDNKMVPIDFKSADYVMRHPSQMLNLTSNLIPFVGNDSGGRVSMATRHMEQAISLVDRDTPLVQVGTGNSEHGLSSFEKVIGAQVSHSTPVDGHVTKVGKDSIHIKGSDGKEHEVQIYNHYPLNDAKSVMHSTPVVKAGDKVKAGQLVADTNFSKDGTLALGKNMRVAYMSMRGYNFEDGVVISETAAKKLSSPHLHKHFLPVDDNTVFGAKKFRIQHPGLYRPEHYDNLDEKGVIKVGAKVKPGDPLVLAMKPFELSDRIELAKIRKSLSGGHADKSMRWESDTEGEVVAITHGKTGIQVHVRTVEPMQVGDKISNRHGAKGIISAVLPDHEMPHDKDKKPIEVLQNFTGIGNRMNPGQIFEAAASKIALKTGKPYVVENFPHNVDQARKLQEELKSHGLSDTEELFDPQSGHSLGHVMVGNPHLFKLVHQVDKKVHVTPGMGIVGVPSHDRYDQNLQPGKGMRMGSLGVFAMLAHGAKANLREMMTWKGEGDDPQPNPGKRWQSQHLQVWNAIQTGAPLPTPKSTFAFKKFEDMLKGSGVNIEKKGHEFLISPLTDKHIDEMTGGRVLPNGAARLETRADSSGELKPRAGGLFDEKLTGGHGGTKWSALSLAEPVPNPIFEGPIRALTGLTQKDFDSIVAGEKGVTLSGAVTALKGSHATGGNAIKHLLDKIDVQKELAASTKLLNTLPAAKVDPVLKKVKYLQALNTLGMKATEAYVLTKLPVVPPVLRPASLMGDGNVKYADVNELYKDFSLVNDQLKDPTLTRHLPEEQKANLRRSHYDGVKAIFGYGIPYADAKNKGLLHQISGSAPKHGYFQKTLIGKRLDLSMKSTITPEPGLGLDQVGLPKASAVELFRPFLVKKLQDMGAAKSPLEAQKLLAKPDTPTVHRALEFVMKERPVLLKRDPALHKYSIQGFQPVITEGNSIKIHPLVCGGFNADFDGDTMSVHVPISAAAVAEVHKMKPTNNLFAESSGSIAYTPTLESALGLYKLTTLGKTTAHKYTSNPEVVEAARSGKIHPTDVVEVGGKKTTAGRILLAMALPEPMQKDMMHNLDFRFDKKGLTGILTKLGKEHKDVFDMHINKLKDLGNHASTGVLTLDLPGTGVNNIKDPKKNVYIPFGAHTLSLKDFEADAQTRDAVLFEADKKVAEIKASSAIPAKDKDRRIVEVYSKAGQQIDAAHKEKMHKNPDQLFQLHQAGVKPSWDQYKQIRLAPLLMMDSKNRVIPIPVRKSYGEGLDMAGYWTTMAGARRGSVMKTQEVREPGLMTKLLQNSTMDMLIVDHDCGTAQGAHLPVSEKDVHDRLLASDLKAGDLHLKAGTTLTPGLIGQLRAIDQNMKVHVRSPLHCEHGKGVCQKCMGLSSAGRLHDIGDNVGVMGSHTLGERSVQLSMKEFHSGGVVGGSSSTVGGFHKFQQLMNLPQKIAGAASLAMVGGKIEKIIPTATGVDVVINGKTHPVGKDDTGMPLHSFLPNQTVTKAWTPPKVGDTVHAGQLLSDPHRTTINPHDLYAATKDISQVKNFLVNEIGDLYKDENIKRRHIETVVRGMCNVTKVSHPGDSDLLRGDFHSLNSLQKMNRDLVKAGKRPIEHTPVLKGVSLVPLTVQEDWMGKLQHKGLKETIAEGAAVLARSNIHGTHPIPGLAYGAEYGLTKKHAPLPGMKHLENVPEHHY